MLTTRLYLSPSSFPPTPRADASGPGVSVVHQFMANMRTVPVIRVPVSLFALYLGQESIRTGAAFAYLNSKSVLMDFLPGCSHSGSGLVPSETALRAAQAHLDLSAQGSSVAS